MDLLDAYLRMAGGEILKENPFENEDGTPNLKNMLEASNLYIASLTEEQKEQLRLANKKEVEDNDRFMEESERKEKERKIPILPPLNISLPIKINIEYIDSKGKKSTRDVDVKKIHTLEDISYYYFSGYDYNSKRYKSFRSDKVKQIVIYPTGEVISMNKYLLRILQ